MPNLTLFIDDVPVRLSSQNNDSPVNDFNTQLANMGYGIKLTTIKSQTTQFKPTPDLWDADDLLQGASAHRISAQLMASSPIPHRFIDYYIRGSSALAYNAAEYDLNAPEPKYDGMWSKSVRIDLHTGDITKLTGDAPPELPPRFAIVEKGYYPDKVVDVTAGLPDPTPTVLEITGEKPAGQDPRAGMVIVAFRNTGNTDRDLLIRLESSHAVEWLGLWDNRYGRVAIVPNGEPLTVNATSVSLDTQNFTVPAKSDVYMAVGNIGQEYYSYDERPTPSKPLDFLLWANDISWKTGSTIHHYARLDSGLVQPDIQHSRLDQAYNPETKYMVNGMYVVFPGLSAYDAEAGYGIYSITLPVRYGNMIDPAEMRMYLFNGSVTSGSMPNKLPASMPIISLDEQTVQIAVPYNKTALVFMPFKPDYNATRLTVGYSHMVDFVTHFAARGPISEYVSSMAVLGPDDTTKHSNPLPLTNLETRVVPLSAVESIFPRSVQSNLVKYAGMIHSSGERNLIEITVDYFGADLTSALQYSVQLFDVDELGYYFAGITDSPPQPLREYLVDSSSLGAGDGYVTSLAYPEVSGRVKDSLRIVIDGIVADGRKVLTMVNQKPSAAGWGMPSTTILVNYTKRSP